MLTLYLTTRRVAPGHLSLWSRNSVYSWFGDGSIWSIFMLHIVTSFFVSVNWNNVLWFTLITNGHLAANNSERPAIYCVRKEIRNWNVYSFFTCFFSLVSGILNSTAVRGHGCHPEAVQHLKRIKWGMCMLDITGTVIFPSRCALDGHCMAPLGDTRPCECGLFIRDVCQLNFLPVC